jgi:anaerobic selenocysteine-containing dehydrogenase
MDTGSQRQPGTASGEAETVISMCGICPGSCGVYAHLVNGQLDRITPLENHPRGIVCTRGVHSREIVYSPDRLKHPLKRVGTKGEGRFTQVSWDQALDEIAQRLKEIKGRHGPQALMTYVGRGGFEQSLIDIYAPAGSFLPAANNVLFPFGSPNTAGCNSLCYVTHGLLAPIPTLGTAADFMFSDFENTNLIVVWGSNPATDSPPIKARQIIAAQRRGTRLVVIDQMRSAIARQADQWIAVRSGTDGALALSMMNVIINEDLYDHEFVDNWTAGFDELREYVAAFPPEEVEAVTWVPQEVIVETARAIATARHATLCHYTGLEYTNSGVQNIRAVLILWAITGNLDVPGGLVFRPRSQARFKRTHIEAPSSPSPIGADKYPLFVQLTNGAQPLRGLLVDGASILTSYPQPDLWAQALAALDLLVVVDRFMTADAQYADFVLPATTMYEITSYCKYPGYVQLRQKVVKPIGEARNDLLIFAQLARRLGYGHLYPQSEEELLQFVFGNSAISVEDLRRHPEGVVVPTQPLVYRKYEKGLLRKDGQPGFNTPSGKVEIASSMLAEYGYDPLPIYTEPVEGPLGSPELLKEFPLVFNSGARIQSAFRSQHLNIPGLLKMQPEPNVLINPQDAEARGIADGDKVYVKSPRGRVPFRAKVTDRVVPGSVEVNVGGGGPLQPEPWREANANYLTDMDNRDPISGFAILKALLCEVRKASAGE